MTKGLTVAPEAFKSQLAFLLKFYDVIDIDSFYSHIKDSNADFLGKSAVLLTFDDGYSDFKTTVLPVLEEFNVPAIVYVSPGFWDKRARLWWYELEDIVWQAARDNTLYFTWQGSDYNIRLVTDKDRVSCYYMLHGMMMAMGHSMQAEFLDMLWDVSEASSHAPYAQMLSQDDIKWLSSHRLITIGAHTYSHSVLPVLSRQDAIDEVIKGKKILEDVTDRPIDHFAYPYGAASRREYDLIRELGFKTAVTMNPRTISQSHIRRNDKKFMFSLPRLSVRGDVPYPASIKVPLSGIEEYLLFPITFLKISISSNNR